jgi:hypothetical protein
MVSIAGSSRYDRYCCMRDNESCAVRRCSCCSEVKPLTCYGTYRLRGLLARRATCKQCLRDKQMHRYNDVPGTRERMIATTNRRHLKTHYGITPEDVAKMKERQGNRCAICKKEKKLCVDHCHKTGKVRALLCHNCNTAIGMLKESPKLFMMADAYVRWHERGKLRLHCVKRRLFGSRRTRNVSG